MDFWRASIGLGEQGNNLVRAGKLREAIVVYQRAAREAEREEPPDCLECGGKENYWPNWWLAHITLLELILAARMDDLITGPSPQASHAIAVSLTTH